MTTSKPTDAPPKRRTKPYREHLLERLQTPDERVSYLQAAFEENDEATLRRAIQDVCDSVNGNNILGEFQFALETCDLNHNYAFIVGQPKPRCPWCLEQGLVKAQAAGQGEAAWIMSVVMIKHGPSIVNTQNKLYELGAVSRDEAQGKVIRLAQSDFPQHQLHTVCGIEITRAAIPSSPAPDKGEVARRAAMRIAMLVAARLRVIQEQGASRLEPDIASIIEAELGAGS